MADDVKQLFGKSCTSYFPSPNGAGCTGHRSGGGTPIDVQYATEQIISRDDDNSSFVRSLYEQINVELNARKRHAIYKDLGTVSSPIVGNVISVSDLNNALDVIQTYYTVQDTDVDETYDYTDVSVGNFVKKTDFIDVLTKFNNSVITDCICYSDCPSYKVCACYGHCSHY